MEFLVIHHAARWGWWPVQRRRCWFLSADFGEYANKVVEDRIGLMPREKCGRFCTVYSRYVFAQKLCRTIQTPNLSQCINPIRGRFLEVVASAGRVRNQHSQHSVCLFVLSITSKNSSARAEAVCVVTNTASCSHFSSWGCVVPFGGQRWWERNLAWRRRETCERVLCPPAHCRSGVSNPLATAAPSGANRVPGPRVRAGLGPNLACKRVRNRSQSFGVHI